MKKHIKILAVSLVLVFGNCGQEHDDGVVDTPELNLEIWHEQWDTGNAKVDYQYYLDAVGSPVKHGYFKEYTRLVDRLVMQEGKYSDGIKTGVWYNRCNQGPFPPTFINGGFENGNFSGWLVDGGETNSIELVGGDAPEQGQFSAKLTLNDNRVELVRTDPGNYLEERIYTWRFKIDKDFKDEPYWMLICQFHSQPDFPKGETWDNYPELRPPVSIAYEDGEARLVLIPLDQITTTLGFFPLEKGVWVDIFLQIKWSLEDDGYIEMFVDGKPVTAFNGIDYKYYGPNVHNEVGNFLKIGLYRDHSASEINSVYIDNLTIDDC